MNVHRCFTAVFAVLFQIFFTTAAVCEPCTDIPGTVENSFTERTVTGFRPLYQLQNAEPETIAATSFDVVIMDYSIDGSESGRYSPSDIRLLKGGDQGTGDRSTGDRSAGGRRSGGRELLAYLSIGEAEDYRSYFQSSWVSLIGKRPTKRAPCWLGKTNPDWKGNFKVQYWSADWQQIVLDYLDRIIDDGFDGVYLDIVDAYEYWSDNENGEGILLSQEDAALRMIEFVKRISYHARVTRGMRDFLVVPQNAEGILEFDTGIGNLGMDDYLNTISAIGIEDLYYDETRIISREVTDHRMQFLERIRRAGKTVIVTDYVDNGKRPVDEIIGSFRSRAIQDGFIPYAARTDRALDSVNTFPGQP